ncbi:MAG: type II secretion system protein GspL [Pseudomonadota bacterium]|nr:type II secretion system protein GspL [Pseudomonadota bacterium]
MRETLYIRLRVAEPDAPTAYCIASGDAVASFVVENAALEAVLAHATGRRLVVLIPSADVRLAVINLPAKQVAKVLQAVPYLLEEQLADDVETLHFALGTRQPDGSWPVAVVAHERLRQWLAFFTERGIRPDAMIPDVLALAVPDEQQFSMLIDGDQVLVRSRRETGFVCGRDDLELSLQLADPDGQRALRIAIPRDQDFDPSTLGRTVEPLHGYAQPLDALLQSLRPDRVIDLLQGTYSVKQGLLRHWLPWRLAASLAGVAIVLAGTVHGIQAWRIGSELTALNIANEERYKKIFPAESRIVDLDAQLSQQMARLSGGASNPKLLSLVGTVASAQAAVSGVKIDALQYREGALYVGMSAANLQALDALKAWFEQAEAGALEVQSANAGTDGVQIRIKLTPS